MLGVILSIPTLLPSKRLTLLPLPLCNIEKMNGLRASIEAACAELSNAAKNATTVEFNGAAFETVTDQMKAVNLLISKMAPVVREISKHSLNANELVWPTLGTAAKATATAQLAAKGVTLH